MTNKSTKNYSAQIAILKQKIDTADIVIIGAGAGLSASAGLTYVGKRFDDNFSDFRDKYNISDIYSGGFYPFESLEEYWSWWSRQIYINRYNRPQSDVYLNLLKLVKGKNYFVITTNVDHLFQDHGFDKKRLFYTQGDYGLWQCSTPCHHKTYNNEETVRKMVEMQHDMRVPSELIPKCPLCGSSMTMNLRMDNTFVQDAHWHSACTKYETFINGINGSSVVFLELGVGLNTPSIIKYPFWQMTFQNSNATYASLSLDESKRPKEIENRSIYIKDDIGVILLALRA